MEQIRVLHILHSMNRGGAETMIMNYYRNINRKKVIFDFLLTEQNHCDYEDEILSLGGRIYRITPLSFNNFSAYIRDLDNFFLEHTEYKIVHSHTSSKSTFPLWIAKKNNILVRICHSHNAKTEPGLKGNIRNLLKFPLRQVSSEFFACGEDAAIWLYGKRFCSRNKINILKNAIDSSLYKFDIEKRKKIKQEFGLSDNLVIGHIGRFNTQKNHQFLIDVFEKIYLKNKNARLLLVGDGNLRKEIEQKISNKGLSSVVILTGVRSDVPEILQAMDALVFPSLNEGLPVSIVEAQASGLACFLTDNIDESVKITKDVEFIPLEKSGEYWAETVIDYLNKHERHDTKKEIMDAGYDIKENAKWLESYYILQN